MKRKIMNGGIVAVTLLAVVLLTSCSIIPQADTGKSSSETVTVGKLYLTSVSLAAPMDVCPEGGITVYGGVDTNANGELDPPEVKSTQYVCNGARGNDGTSALLSIADEPEGSNCQTGGKKVAVGKDANNNGVLDQSETSSSAYICNGLKVVDGAAGEKTLLSIVSEPSATMCPDGGVAIRYGIDGNANNVLDPSEVETVNYVCNGSSGQNGNQSPSTPSYVWAWADNGSVSLSWGSSLHATSYNIYWSTSAGVTKTNGTKIGNITSSWYEHMSLANGTTYHYVITAVNSFGESAESYEVSATPTAPTTPPPAPWSVYASAGNGQISLSWMPSSGAESYNIYWSTSPGVSKANGTKIADVTSTLYEHLSLTNGTMYYYIVTAVNSFGESEASSVASATPAEPPAAPAGVAALAGDGQVTITWNAVKGVSNYMVYWSTASGVTTTSSNYGYAWYDTSYQATGLSNGTQYYFIVTAYNYSAGESAASVEVSATPIAGATAPRTELASLSTGTSAALKGVFTNAQGYVTNAWFEYGDTTAYGAATTAVSYIQTGSIDANAELTGLAETTTYHYRLVTQNSAGTFYGNDRTFATAQTPVVLATVPYSYSTAAMAVDSTGVYWSETDWWEGASIRKVGLGGGAVMTMATGLTPSYSSNIVNSMTTDSEYIYCTAAGQYDSGAGSVIKIAKEAPNTVTVLASGLTGPRSIHIDSSDIFWVEASSTSQIRKMSKAGGGVTTLVTTAGTIVDIGSDAANVYWSQSAGGSASINKIGKTGGTITNLATDSWSWSASNIKIASGSIYYATSGILKSIAVDGGTPTVIASLESSLGNAPLIGVDATDAFVISGFYPGNISKVRLSDGTMTTLAVGVYPWAGAMDTASIYWVDYESIKRISK